MNIFKEMIMSVSNFEAYNSFLKNKKIKVFGYGILISSIYFLLTLLIPAMLTNIKIGGLENFIQEKVPYFEYSDNELYLDKKLEYKTDSQCLIIDTSGISYDKRDFKGYSSLLIIDYEKIIAVNNQTNETIYFSQMPEIGDFSKDDLIEIVPVFYFYIIIVIIALYFLGIIGFFLGAFVMSLIGCIINMSAKANITYGQLFKISVYSRTLPVLLSAVISFFSLKVPFTGLISFVLSSIYIYFALTKINNKNIDINMNNQIN